MNIEIIGVVVITIVFIYMIFIVRKLYTDFAEPVDEHTQRIKELENRISKIEGKN